MFPPARDDSLATFHDEILTPRSLDYKVVFPGPAGNNAVEAALKLARKVTGRESVVNFTNAFHGKIGRASCRERVSTSVCAMYPKTEVRRTTRASQQPRTTDYLTPPALDSVH